MYSTWNRHARKPHVRTFSGSIFKIHPKKVKLKLLSFFFSLSRRRKPMGLFPKFFFFFPLQHIILPRVVVKGNI